MASSLGVGAVTVLDYAERLWQVPLGVTTSGFLIVSLSEWSHHGYGGGTTGTLSRQMRRSAVHLFAVFLPIALFISVFRQPIAALVVGHGRFPVSAVPTLANTLATLVAVTPVYVVGLAYTRAFLALKRSDWLLAVGFVTLVIKIALNLLLMPRFGLIGLAMSTSVMYLFSSLAMVVIYHSVLACSSRSRDSSVIGECRHFRATSAVPHHARRWPASGVGQAC